ncbi:MAG: hypothetical protein HY681_13450 [Chloroflexi bacterium]|nr:hypothetical protein [Chloroflexota bacterium]
MGHLAKVPVFLKMFLLTGALTLAVACEGEERPLFIQDEKGASLEVEGRHAAQLPSTGSLISRRTKQLQKASF